MVIDVHTHIWQGRYESDKAALLEAAEVYGIDEIYVSPLGDPIPSVEDVCEFNSEMAKFVKEQPDIIRGYVYVSPEHDDAMDVLKRGIEEQGLVGLKLWISRKCDDVTVNPLIEKCIEYGVPVLLHSFHKANGQYEFESVGINVANLARRYPEAKLIMAHISGNCYDGIRAVRDIPNVWVDYCGSIFQQDALQYALEEIGADRLLHGSDMPGSYIVNLGQLDDLDISAEDREKILWKNTVKLFDTSFRLGR